MNKMNKTLPTRNLTHRLDPRWFEEHLNDHYRGWTQQGVWQDAALRALAAWGFGSLTFEHDADTLLLQFRIRPTTIEEGLDLELILTRDSNFLASFRYRYVDGFEPYRFRLHDTEYCVTLEDIPQPALPSETEPIGSTCFWFQLPNGRWLVLRYGQDCLNVGLAHGASDEPGWVCRIGQDGTEVYGNSCDAGQNLVGLAETIHGRPQFCGISR